MPYNKTVFPTIVNFIKNNQRNEFTYQEIGIHYATLNSLVKRDYLTKNANGKYSLTAKGHMFAKIEYYTSDRDYFILKKVGEHLGMMCSIKGPDILDAWDKPWNWNGEPLRIMNPINKDVDSRLRSC